MVIWTNMAVTQARNKGVTKKIMPDKQPTLSDIDLSLMTTIYLPDDKPKTMGKLWDENDDPLAQK